MRPSLPSCTCPHVPAPRKGPTSDLGPQIQGWTLHTPHYLLTMFSISEDLEKCCCLPNGNAGILPGASWQSQRVFLETPTLPKDEAISSLVWPISLEGSPRVMRFQTCTLGRSLSPTPNRKMQSVSWGQLLGEERLFTPGPLRDPFNTGEI